MLKNSPKFFIYIFALVASTTVVKVFNRMSSPSTLCTAVMTSESLPTPEGSMRMRSGAYSVMTFFSAAEKSPTREQQMHPEFSSFTVMPASFIKAPSTPISPNSFSTSTSFSPAYASLISFLIRVVLPAPKNPENISIFTIFSFLLSMARFVLFRLISFCKFAYLIV